MPRARLLLLWIVACAAVIVAACGNEPPEKEMQQAQGAIDAARAAGAETFAHDELAAAESALKAAHDSVAQNDYRLALNSALSSREHAMEATRQSVDRKAAARADADRQLTEAVLALRDGRAKLKAAETAHAPARTLADGRKAIADVEQAVQKARADILRSEFDAVPTALDAPVLRLRATMKDLDSAVNAAARRRR